MLKAACTESTGRHLCELDDVFDAVQPDKGVLVSLLHHIPRLQEALLVKELCRRLHT
jgi:hypothetical protein